MEVDADSGENKGVAGAEVAHWWPGCHKLDKSRSEAGAEGIQEQDIGKLEYEGSLIVGKRILRHSRNL